MNLLIKLSNDSIFEVEESFVFDQVTKKKSEIKKLLEIVAGKKNEEILILPRQEERKNPYDFMAELGLSITDVKEIIRHLSLEDYLETKLDSGCRVIYWYVFLKDLSGKTAYIKFGFRLDDRTGKLLLISFHEAMRDEMDRRPFKKKGE